MTTGSNGEQVLSRAYHNVIIHCHNPKTLKTHRSRLKKFLNYNQASSYDELLFGMDTKQIQDRIETFLHHMQNPDYNLSSSSVRYYYVSLKFFYEMNNVILNWKIIQKVLPRARKTANDRPYTIPEIARMLEKVDQRGRVIILLMCSSGMRVGGIPALKVAHLERLEDIYKITVYKNDPEQYTTFCSIECSKAIDDYLEYRKRYGELIKPFSPLIREQFNKVNPESSAVARHLCDGSIREVIYRAVNDSGIREKKNIVKGQKKYMHEVMETHGLRKFFNTQIVIAGMPPIYSEMLMGHKGELALGSYVKPTTAQLMTEYMKVVDSVTIDQSQRVQRENAGLRKQITQMDELRLEIEKVKEKIKL